MKTLHFPDDFRGPGAFGFAEYYGDTAGKLVALPKALRLETAALEVKPDRLVLPAAIVNATDERLELVVAPGVVSLAFAPGQPVAQKPWKGPPRPPPVPPPPMLLEVPTQSRIEVRAELLLGDFTWKGTPAVKLRWQYDAWDGSGPSGDLAATLPKR
jgi:hypothetical protein